MKTLENEKIPYHWKALFYILIVGCLTSLPWILREISGTEDPKIWKLIPFDKGGVQQFVLQGLFPIYLIPIGLLSGYGLVNLLISFHSIINKKPLYTLFPQERLDKKIRFKKVYFRGLLLSAFAFALSISLSDNEIVQEYVMVSPLDDFNTFFFTFNFLMYFFILLGSLIFTPLWLLEDCPIFYYKSEENILNFEVSSVNKSFNK